MKREKPERKDTPLRSSSRLGFFRVLETLDIERENPGRERFLHPGRQVFQKFWRLYLNDAR